MDDSTNMKDPPRAVGCMPMLDGGEAETAQRLNRYCCEQCHKNVITIDRDKGVTPFMIPCLRTPGCPGPMTSRFYQVEPIWGPPTYEWRKPTKKEYKKMSPAMKQHIDMGGLDLYPLGQKKAV